MGQFLPPVIKQFETLEFVINRLAEPAAVVRADGAIVLASKAWAERDLSRIHSSQLHRMPAKNCSVDEIDVTEVDFIRVLESTDETPSFWLSKELDLSLEVCRVPFESDSAHYLLLGDAAKAGDKIEGRLSVALDSMRGGVWEFDIDNGQVYRSAGVCELLGIAGGVNDATKDQWLERIHPEDLQEVKRSFSAHLDGETTVYATDYRIRAASGDWIWMRDHGRVVARHADGRPRRIAGVCADVTDVVELRHQNRRYKAQLELALSSFALEIWEYDAENGQVYLSPELARRLGYPAQPQDVKADDLVEFLEPDDLPSVQKAFETFESGKSSIDVEARVGSIAEQRRWCRISATRNDINNDGSLHVVGAIQDIHNRKSYELDLIEGESQFRRMADAAPIHIWMGADRSGDCTFVNRHWVSETGVAFELQLEGGWLDQVHPEDRSEVESAIQQVNDTNDEREVEFRLRRESGDYAFMVGRVTIRADMRSKRLGLLMVLADVTPLQLAEAQLSLALDAAQAGLWDWRVKEDKVFTNARAHLMLGEPIPVDELKLNWFLDRLHPDDHDRTRADIKAAHESGDNQYRVEFRFRQHDGSYRWIESTGRVIERDHDDSPLRMIGLHIDIEDRKRNEQHLARLINDHSVTRTRLEDMLEHAPASVAMFDTQMRYIVASHRWKEDYGLFDTALIGQCHYDIFPEIGDDWKRIHQECLQGNVRRCEEDRFERADGRTQILRWEVRPWFDRNSKEIGGIAMYTEDITARVKAERQVYDSYLQKSAIFAASRDPLIMVRADGRINKVSQTVDHVFGCASTELENVLVHDLFVNLDGFIPVVDDGRIDNAALEEIAGRPFEISAIHRDGHNVACEVNISPVQIPDNESVLFVASVRDISDRKRVEQEREQRIADMSHLSRLAAVDMMGVELAHEFRQPLGAIRNYVHAAKLLDGKHSGGRKRIGSFLDEIEVAVGHMTELLESMRLFGRKPELERQRLTIAEVVAGAINLTSTRMRQLGVVPQIELGQTDQFVFGSNVQLQQVVLNIILNALDAVEPIRMGERNIRIYNVTNEDNMVEIRVEDSGNGVAPSIRDHLFEPLQSTNPNGLGMGLSISRQIVEAHQGELMLVDQCPTTFAIRLPRFDRVENHEG